MTVTLSTHYRKFAERTKRKKESKNINSTLRLLQKLSRVSKPCNRVKKAHQKCIQPYALPLQRNIKPKHNQLFTWKKSTLADAKKYRGSKTVPIISNNSSRTKQCKLTLLISLHFVNIIHKITYYVTDWTLIFILTDSTYFVNEKSMIFFTLRSVVLFIRTSL